MISSNAVSATNPERLSPLRIEAARPAIDDPHDHRIGLPPDQRRHLRPCHPLQSRDLLADRHRKPRHAQAVGRPP